MMQLWQAGMQQAGPQTLSGQPCLAAASKHRSLVRKDFLSPCSPHLHHLLLSLCHQAGREHSGLEETGDT